MIWEGEGPFWDKPQARQVSPPEGGREMGVVYNTIVGPIVFEIFTKTAHVPDVASIGAPACQVLNSHISKHGAQKQIPQDNQSILSLKKATGNLSFRRM
jgi:hypothetical protein